MTTPLRRKGSKQSEEFEPISWESALDETAERLLKAEQQYGSETVWPYFFAGTMGLVMRDGINRLRHAKDYSGEHKTICTTPSFNGFIAGTGKLAGVDPREMSDSDQVILWGTNAASTQVNVMSHVLKARQQRGARLVVLILTTMPQPNKQICSFAYDQVLMVPWLAALCMCCLGMALPIGSF